MAVFARELMIYGTSKIFDAGGFLGLSEYTKFVLRRTPLGSLLRSPTPLVRWGWGYPSFDPFDTWILIPTNILVVPVHLFGCHGNMR